MTMTASSASSSMGQCQTTKCWEDFLEDYLSAFRASNGLADRPPLLQRRFIAPPGAEKPQDPGPVSLRVMQFNILAKGLSGPESGFVCDQEVMKWPQRRARILEEIVTRSPDLIGLEEMDDFEYFKKELGHLGYEGSFAEKRDSPCLGMANNIGPDGCAIFFKTELFQVLHQGSEVLKGFNGHASNQIVLWKTFKHKHCDVTFNFLVTHLKAKESPEYMELRKLQGQSLVQIMDQLSSHSPNYICVGDFNGDPTEPVYEVMKKKLTSAYSQGSEDGSEPEWTTWKIRKTANGEKKRTIDYIWYSENIFEVSKLLEIPTGEEIGVGRLPSLSFPSDHISIAADFYLKTK